MGDLSAAIREFDTSFTHRHINFLNMLAFSVSHDHSLVFFEKLFDDFEGSEQKNRTYYVASHNQKHQHFMH